MKFYRYLFQQSKIWEAGDPVDPQGDVHVITARSLERARRKLPSPGTGRKWVLVEHHPK